MKKINNYIRQIVVSAFFFLTLSVGAPVSAQKKRQIPLRDMVSSLKGGLFGRKRGEEPRHYDGGGTQTETAGTQTSHGELGDLASLDGEAGLRDIRLLDWERIEHHKKMFVASKDAIKRKFRNTALLSLGTTAAATIAYKMFLSGSSNESGNSGKKEGHTQIVEAEVTSENAQIQQVLADRDRNKNDKERNRLMQKEQQIFHRAKDYLTKAVCFGLGVVIVGGFTPFCSFLYGKGKEAIRLYVSGFPHWYEARKEMMQESMQELGECLLRAQKLHSNYNDQARTQREGYVMGYHRMGTVDLYLRSLGMLERVIALAYLIAPLKKHDRITLRVRRIEERVRKFAASLTRDLEAYGDGFFPEYSNETIHLFHQWHDAVGVFASIFEIDIKE